MMDPLPTQNCPGRSSFACLSSFFSSHFLARDLPAESTQSSPSSQHLKLAQTGALPARYRRTFDRPRYRSELPRLSRLASPLSALSRLSRSWLADDALARATTP